MQRKSREDVKAWLKAQNLTQTEWGRRNGYSSNEISRVLSGKSKLNYGREREIAIKLGLHLEI